MNVSDLLDLDVIASLDDDGGLLLDAPKGALTPELIERIRHSKALLIAEIVGGRDVDELGQPHRATAPPSGDGGDTPTDTAPSTRPTDWLPTPTGKEPLDRTPVEHADAPAAESNMITAELLAEVRKGTHRNRHFELYAHALKRGCSTCRRRATRTSCSSAGTSTAAWWYTSASATSCTSPSNLLHCGRSCPMAEKRSKKC